MYVVVPGNRAGDKLEGERELPRDQLRLATAGHIVEPGLGARRPAERRDDDIEDTAIMRHGFANVGVLLEAERLLLG